MTGEQLPDSGGLDPTTRHILDLLNGDPLHDADRERILAAVHAEGVASGGLVDPNRVRIRLSDDRGNLVVNPRVLSGFYHRLAHIGYLTPAGRVRNTSRGNGNKETTTWRLARPGRVAS